MKGGWKMNHYIYVDDIREDDRWFNTHLRHSEWMPHISRTCEHTIDLIRAILLSGESATFILDLDHDLGEGNENELEPSGYEICKWIVENHIPLVGFHIHSMNPVGAMNMRQLLTHYGYREL